MADIKTLQQQLLQQLLLGQRQLGVPPISPTAPITPPQAPALGTAPQPYQPPRYPTSDRNRGGY